MATSFKLLDGTTVPWLAWGNGTGQAKKDAVNSGKLALVSGIRHIDTAQIYDNEKETGIAITESSIPQDEVYVTSKLWCDEADSTDSSKIRASVEDSLDRLGLIPDCYLIHTPSAGGYDGKKLKEIWKVFESLKDEGKLRSIGVSNFRPQDLEAILDGAKYKPVVNQLEVHPYTLAHLEPVFKVQEQHGIVTTSYGTLTPLLRHPTGGPLKPVLAKISERLSEKYGETIDPAAVLCLWAKAKKIVVVTASGNEGRIKGFAKLYQSNWE
ncbi:conjugated polyketone reductase C1 [Coprinopsis sp. MPI-PUGE-AT-0042]|nr:conjugated polyketone reductase C1 [Coprinopsis sp. MPI-PUGE-AT-0042]